MRNEIAVATMFSLSLLSGCSHQTVYDLAVLDVTRVSASEVLGQLEPYYADGIRRNPAIKGFVRVSVVTQENVVTNAIKSHASLGFDSYRCGADRASGSLLGLPGVYVDGKELRRISISDPKVAGTVVKDREGRYIYQAYLFDTVSEDIAISRSNVADVCLRIRGASMLSNFYSNEVQVSGGVPESK